jgi:hypothetical protein
MPSVRTLTRSFASGEVTPELFGRLDLQKRAEGLALCKNFITLPHGPAVNRPGTQFVREVKTSANATRLIPFSYNNLQTFIVELGAGYFRWHTNAATLSYADGAAYSNATAYSLGDIVKTGGINYYSLQNANHANPPAGSPTFWYPMPTAPNIYEIPNPFAAADLFDIHFVQSADVLTLVHPGYAPLELRRLGATNWQTSFPVFTPPANSISGIVWRTDAGGVPPAATANFDYAYVITTIANNTLEESVASATSGQMGYDLTVVNTYIKGTITDANPSANIRYYVYKKVNASKGISSTNGLYGFVGQASIDPDTGAYIFRDNNIAPDVSRTPPITDANAAFATSGNYPGAVSYFQQRRIFAGSTNDPQRFWATRTGTESNMSYNIPVTSDNRINVRIASREASTIRHIVPAGQLLLLTASAEWRCGAAGDVLTPASINLAPQSYVGSSNVAPVVVNNIVLYAAARGGHIRELSYSWSATSFVSGDICLMAPHLFDGYTIADMAYSRGPTPILWCVSSSGKLLGMTYVPEQQVAAWHQHDSGASGKYESCAVITENNEDMLYVIVNRTINGATKRYVERLHSRLWSDTVNLSDTWYLDAALSTTIPALGATVSGLSHLEGCTVTVQNGTGALQGLVVSGGQITVPAAISGYSVIGLPINAQAQLPPLAAQVDGALGQGRTANATKAYLRVVNSANFQVGQSFIASDLQWIIRPPNGPLVYANGIVSGIVDQDVLPLWSTSEQLCIAQPNPFPVTVTAITIEAAIGG